MSKPKRPPPAVREGTVWMLFEHEGECASQWAVIEEWRREYNEARPMKALGGLTPWAYARQLAQRVVASTPRL
jgi:hypothetical protein